MISTFLVTLHEMINESRALADQLRGLPPERVWMYQPDDEQWPVTLSRALTDFHYQDERTPEERQVAGMPDPVEIERYPGLVAIPEAVVPRIERLNELKDEIKALVQELRAETRERSGQRALQAIDAQSMRRAPELAAILGDKGLSRLNLLKVYRHLVVEHEVQKVAFSRVNKSRATEKFSAEEVQELVAARLERLGPGSARTALELKMRELETMAGTEFRRVKPVAPFVRVNAWVPETHPEKIKDLSKKNRPLIRIQARQAAMPLFVVGDRLPPHNGASLPGDLLDPETHTERQRRCDAKIEAEPFIKALNIYVCRPAMAGAASDR